MHSIAQLQPVARSGLTAAVLVAALAMAGCARKVDQPAAGAAAGPLPLDLTMADLMRASVEIPADGIWGVTAEEKLNDDQWSLVEQDAVNLIVAGTLITTPTTGPKDKEWSANADWRTWAEDVKKTGAAIREAAKAKDMMKLSMNGDHLLEVCQGCHDKYRPETPSDGAPAKFPFYPARKYVPE
jgi:hypothetical protein